MGSFIRIGGGNLDGPDEGCEGSCISSLEFEK